MNFVATLLMIIGGTVVGIAFLGWALKPRRRSSRRYSSRRY